MRGRVLSFIAIASFAALGFGSQSVRAQAKGPSFELTADHVGLSVPNLEKSIDWYEQMLGFHLVRRTNGKSMQIALLQRGGFHIELFAPMDGRPMPDYRHDPSADLHVYGMKHVGFAVKDVRAAIAELKSKGVEVALGPIENKTTVFAFIRDNSGIPLELIQHKQ